MANAHTQFSGNSPGTDKSGVPILAIRNDADAVLTGVADGDWSLVQVDENGYLKVVDMSGGGGGGSGTEYTEDAAAAANPVGGMLILRRKDSLSGSEVSADGDNIAANATSKGELYVKHTDAIPVTDNGSTLSIDDGAGSITVDGTVAVSGTVAVTDNSGSLTVDGSVTADTELPSAAALADGASNPTTPTVGAGALLFNGSTWDRMRGDTTNGLDVDVTRLPASARTTDSVAAALQTDAIMSNLTALTPKFVIIDHNTSGDNTILAAVTSKKIRVLALFLVSAGTVTVRFESGAGGPALTGQMNLVANTGFVLPFNPVGWFETASNTLLNLELSGAVSVDGSLVYVEV